MGRPNKEENAKKLTLLEGIRSKKHVLFGQFSSRTDKHDIEGAWEEILGIAKSLALLSEKSTTGHMRKLFSQWKSRTMEKKDNAGKTGTGGGRNCKLTEIDNLLLDIVGRESPVVVGLPVGESGYYEDDDVDQISEPSFVFNEGDVLKEINQQTPGVASTSKRGAETVPENKENDDEFLVPTKKRKAAPKIEKDPTLEEKWQAQIELVRQQAYNFKLQNYKLEVELGLPSSEFTKSLYC